MKKIVSKLLIIIGLISAITFSAKAQVNDVGNFLKSGVDDASLLFGEYFRPWTNALGADLNSGWYNTAKPHGKFGFDITFNVSTAIVPDAHKSFSINDLSLDRLTLAPSESAIAPTIVGDNSAGPLLELNETYNGNTYTLASFKTPEGISFAYAPLPMVKAGVGLLYDTELMLRFLPPVNIENTGKVGFWGVGFKHSLKQWIPVVKKLPVLNLSVMAAYTKLNGEADLNYEPYIPEGATETPTNYDDQILKVGSKSFTASLLVSADIKIVSVYGGLGFATNSTDMQILGHYPVYTLNSSTGEPELSELVDPLDISISNISGSKTNPRINTGLRFKFAFFTLNFDYTYCDYSVATVGFGFSFN